jgi:hypothetical protein
MMTSNDTASAAGKTADVNVVAKLAAVNTASFKNLFNMVVIS